MKKFLLAALSIMMVFGIVSCSDEPGEKPSAGDGLYTVTFDANLSGATPATQKVKATKAANGTQTITVANMPNPPSATGKVFDVWKVNKDGTGATFSGTTAVTKNITVYATWKDGFRVDFNKNHSDAAGFTEADPTWKAVVSPATNVSTLPKEPTRGGGFAFTGWNTVANGSGTAFDEETEVTASITVYAQWVKGTAVIFHDNDGVHNHSVSVVVPEGDDYDPAKTPAGPKNEKEYYAFAYWSYSKEAKAEDIGTPQADAFDQDDVDLEDGDVNVYAIWKFVGGKPIENEARTVMTITRPFFTVGGGAAAEENTITFTATAGTAAFAFPAQAADYDYFVIARSMVEGQATNSALYDASNSMAYPIVALGVPQSPTFWIGNDDWRHRAVYGPGANPADPPIAQTGFTIRAGGADDRQGKVTFSSITFYKFVKFTVNFDLNYDGAAVISPVTDIIGVDGRINGTGVGAANWPTVPDRSTEVPPAFFLGWFNNLGAANEAEYTAVSPISAATTLKAKWTNVEPDKVEKVTTTGSNNALPVFRFTPPVGKTYADYKTITYFTYVDSATKESAGTARKNLMFAPFFEAGPVEGTTVVTPDTGFNNGFWDINGIDWGNTCRAAQLWEGALSGRDDVIANQWVKWTMKIDGTEVGASLGASGTRNGKDNIPPATSVGPWYLGVGFGPRTASPWSYYITAVCLVEANGTLLPADGIEDGEYNPPTFDMTQHSAPACVIAGADAVPVQNLSMGAQGGVTRAMAYTPAPKPSHPAP